MATTGRLNHAKNQIAQYFTCNPLKSQKTTIKEKTQRAQLKERQQFEQKDFLEGLT